MNDLEASLLFQIGALSLPIPETQYQLPGRKFRWDMAWPDYRLLADIQGGGWVLGRHHRPGGYREDCIKSNLATIAGWRVLRVDTSMVESGEAVDTIKRALGNTTGEAK
jgi:very-short-patch-repair endonuclease